MFAQFRVRYPTGSLISELLTIHHGKFVVRALVQVDGVTKATGMAAADTLEQAEDQARIRALEVMGIHLSWKGNSEAIDSQVTPSEFPRRSIFSSERQESSNMGQVTTDPSWSTNRIEPSFSERTGNVTPAKAVTYPTKSGAELSDNTNWKSDSSVENGEIATTSSGNEIEKTIPFGKVTPLASRRHDPEIAVVHSPQFGAQTVDTSTEDNSADEPDDLSELIARTNVEIRRLGWTKKQGSDYLQRKYGDGKKTRQDLTKEELADFLEYLESQPNPS